MRKAVKWIGIGLGSLVALVLVAAGVAYVVGSRKVDRTYVVQTASLTLPTDSASLARGAHLVNTHGCRDCHGADLAGQVLEDAPPFRAVAANLTRGRGGIGGRSVEDLDRAIRHGVKPDGRPVLIMPSAAFHNLSDEDAAALIAYVKSVPPVDRELPPTEVRVPGRILAAVALDPAAEVRLTRARAARAPAPGPTAEYGAYLVSTSCTHCHGEDLRGNPTPPGPPGMLPAPDITAAASRWSLEQWRTTLRTGTTPEGRKLDARFMPWGITAKMTDDELAALHAHLRSLAGGRPTADATR